MANQSMKEIRRNKLRQWVSENGVPREEKSLFSQLFDPSGSFGERVARRLEKQYAMGDMFLDRVGNEMSDDIKIPQFDVGGGMGRPTLLLDDQPGVIRNWDVDEPWIRHNVRNHTGLQNLCIVTGFGPSMQPLYNPGDPLLVDRGVKIVDIDGIFFFRIADHGYIKWLQRIPKGPETILMATSENSRFIPFEITSDMDFEVLGRVLTVWKSSQF